MAPKGALTIDGVRSSCNSRRTHSSVGICGAVWIHRLPIHEVGREFVHSRSGRSIAFFIAALVEYPLEGEQEDDKLPEISASVLKDNVDVRTQEVEAVGRIGY